MQYPIGKKQAEYTAPNGVTSIGNYAFLDCPVLEKIVLPNGLTTIGDTLL
ncbi:hypothetical protein FACS1894132_13610 [Clostridia bacterium]|nr:hypothetical protein FACS1894132_13610 [Clostridia bacterium]